MGAMQSSAQLKELKKIMTKIITLTISILGIIAAIYFYLFGNHVLELFENQSLGQINSRGCSVSSTLVAGVGNQVSSTVLSAKGNRAWARIQQPNNATNTVALSFDEGAAAVLGRGVSLNNNATSTIPDISFGLATAFPYTGAVTGITDIGSTTVLVTECSY
jgi:hypothetical protein